MREQAGRLGPYVPRVASDWDGQAPGSLWRPVEGTLVFVDISGFTNLSERLARRGRIGAEELTVVLNRVFGQMLEVAFARGGSLIKFGGDALLLLFETEDHVLQAVAATVEMRAALREASKEPTSVGRIHLKMSSGIHTGSIDFYLVGDSHRELIVTGPVASTTTEMEGTAGAGEIVVSQDVRAVLPEGFTGASKGHGWLLRKQKVNHPPCGFVIRSGADEQELSSFVPRALRRQLSSGISDSEHRIATVGFVKFQGVDRLLAASGPDSVGQSLDSLVRAVQEAVDDEDVSFLGTDIDANGGKIILVAGVPTSRHDDEGRMLRAASKIVADDYGLEVKVGANRGHVFAGNVGTQFRRTYTVMGDTVNLAARLMAAAPHGALYASPTVLDRSQSLFRTEALEPFLVKGKQEPVQAYRVWEETGTRRGETKHELPFHGRDGELQMIVGIVTTCAQTGKGGIMTISGDTGIGKSRLIAEVLARCPGLATLMLQAEPNGASNPYWAFRDPMRALLGIERKTQAQMAVSLRRAVKRLAPGLSWAAPLLGDVMQIEVADTPETEAIDPQFRPQRTSDAVVELLEAINDGPFALLAEDGQWMDEASLGLLERVGQAAETRPWTVIVTARQESEEFDTLGSEVRLRPLDADAMRRIAIEATAAAPLRPHQLDAVVERTGGNPLFLSEILKVIRETGTADRIPDSLDAVVSTQIDTLAPLTRQLLRYASVLGTSFRQVVFEALLQPDEIVVDEATVGELDQFIDSDSSERLRFQHAVVHDVAYQGLSYRRRRELHARAGEVIERMAGDDPDAVAAVLANHFSLSGHHEKVWRYARIAAEKARRTYANTEAATHYRKAIEASRFFDGTGPGDVATIWAELGGVQDLNGQYEDARESYGQALRLVGRNGPRSADLHMRRADVWVASGQLSQAKRNLTLGRKAVADSRGKDRVRYLARLDAREASIQASAGDYSKALAAANSAIAGARSTGEEEALALAYKIFDLSNFMLDRKEKRNGEEAIEIYQRLGQVDRSVGVMNNMGAFAYFEGKWDDAVGWYREAIDAAERSGNVFEAATTRANVAEVLISQHRYQEALPLIEDADRVFSATKSELIRPFVALQRARATIGLGEVDEGINQLETVLASQTGGGETVWTTETRLTLADGLARAGRHREALEILDGIARQPDDSARFAARILRVRGVIHEALGEAESAAEAWLGGLESAVEAGDLYEEYQLLEALIRMGKARVMDTHSIDVQRLHQLIEMLGIVEPSLTR